MKYQRAFTVVFVAIVLLTTAVPSMTVYAQGEVPEDSCEGSGTFYWPCRILESLLSGVRNFFTWAINTIVGFFDFLGGVVNWAVTAIGNMIAVVVDIFRLIWSFIESVFALINEAIQIAGLIIQIIVAIVKLLGAWVFQAVAMVVGFLTTFFATSPQAFPGAPQCISAPTSHDLCSLWYLFDNTVWSGDVGSLIVTVILILIDVPIVFLFVRKILSYLRMGESITDVG